MHTLIYTVGEIVISGEQIDGRRDGRVVGSNRLNQRIKGKLDPVEIIRND